MSLRVALLVRVSTDGQALEGSSLETQQARLRELCKTEGLIIVETVEEPGVSGRLEERPGIRRLLQLAEQRLIDLVLVLNPDRFARKLWLQERWINALEKHGVRVRFADVNFEDTDEGVFLRQLYGSLAEREVNIITRRLTNGRREKAADGRLPSRADPYGYRQISAAEAQVLPECRGRSGELVIIEGEAAVVREIYRRYLAGEGQNVICAWLNQGGFPPPDSSLWYGSTLRTILTHPAYKGEFPYGSRRRQAWGPVIAVPGIVPVEIWEQAQTTRAARPRGRQTSTYMLRGTLFCGVCEPGKYGLPLRFSGHRVSATKGRPSYTRRYYSCNSSTHPHRTSCAQNRWADALEAKARELVQEILQPGVMRALIAAELEAPPALPDATEHLQAELARVNAALTRLARQTLEGVFPADIIAGQAAELTSRRATLENQLQGQASNVGRKALLLSALDKAESAAAAWRTQLEGDDPDAWQRACAAHLRVTLTPEKDRWELQFQGVSLALAVT